MVSFVCKIEPDTRLRNQMGQWEFTIAGSTVSLNDINDTVITDVNYLRIEGRRHCQKLYVR
jgi:hypothetical protein